LRGRVGGSSCICCGTFDSPVSRCLMLLSLPFTKLLLASRGGTISDRLRDPMPEVSITPDAKVARRHASLSLSPLPHPSPIPNMAFASGETRWCAKPHETSSLAGRTYAVTGGTGSGLGAHTALHLALRGATVLVGSRTESTALAHIARLEGEHPEIVGRLRFFQVDLGSFEGARAAGERVLGMTGELHGVVNNAGRLATAGPFTLSPDGIEMLAAVK